MGCRDDLPPAEVDEIAGRGKADVVLFGLGSNRSGALGPGCGRRGMAVASDVPQGAATCSGRHP